MSTSGQIGMPTDSPNPETSDREKGMPFILFIVSNLVFSLFVFPIIALIATFVYFNDESGLATSIGVTSLLHLVALWGGLVYFRRARVFVIPFLIATGFTFLLNRRVVVEWTDDGPFGDGGRFVGGQHVWGLTRYYRVFDEPREGGETSYFDWGGLFVGVEFSVLLTVVLGICVLTVWRIARWMDSVDYPLPPGPDLTERL